MEVVKTHVAMLCNYEVYKFLVKSQEEAKNDKKSQDLATITYETKEYLENTPCTSQNPEIIKQIITELSNYDLTKAEKLQLLNITPISPVEIQLVIEEVEERFSEQEISELLEIISKLIPNANNIEEDGAENIET